MAFVQIGGTSGTPAKTPARRAPARRGVKGFDYRILYGIAALIGLILTYRLLSRMGVFGETQATKNQTLADMLLKAAEDEPNPKLKLAMVLAAQDLVSMSASDKTTLVVAAAIGGVGGIIVAAATGLALAGAVAVIGLGLLAYVIMNNLIERRKQATGKRLLFESQKGSIQNSDTSSAETRYQGNVKPFDYPEPKKLVNSSTIVLPANAQTQFTQGSTVRKTSKPDPGIANLPDTPKVQKGMFKLMS